MEQIVLRMMETLFYDCGDLSMEGVETRSLLFQKTSQ